MISSAYGKPSTIQEKGYIVYPVGWFPGGKGDDFNWEVFNSEDQDEPLEKSIELVMIFNQYVTCILSSN